MTPPKKHKYEEAFKLMRYEGTDGEAEVIWNSRDGITPLLVSSVTTGKVLAHLGRYKDVYDPDFKPNIGTRIFMDDENGKPCLVTVTQSIKDKLSK